MAEIFVSGSVLRLIRTKCGVTIETISEKISCSPEIIKQLEQDEDMELDKPYLMIFVHNLNLSLHSLAIVSISRPSRLQKGFRISSMWDRNVHLRELITHLEWSLEDSRKK